MIKQKEIHETPSQDTPHSAPRGTAEDRRDAVAGNTLREDARSTNSMLGTVREMLNLAIEGAFDLRTGREHSTHLQRFKELLDQQLAVLDTLENGVFGPDPSLLTRRAQETLHGFAAAVRHEILEEVRPGMNPTVFDAALQRLTDRAVMAGAAFASLDLALGQL
jgi:hypothetical protein